MGKIVSYFFLALLIGEIHAGENRIYQKRQVTYRSPWDEEAIDLDDATKPTERHPVVVRKVDTKETPKVEEEEEEGSSASGSESEETDDENEEKLPAPANKASQRTRTGRKTPILSDPQSILSPWPGEDEEEEDSKPVVQRAAEPKKNWYSAFDSGPGTQKGRYMGGDDVGGGGAGAAAGGGGAGKDGSGKGGDGSGKNGEKGGGKTDGSGSGSEPKDRNQKNPYNVVKAKPNQLVDPGSYNFFQLQTKSKIGTLWLSKGKKLKGRIDIGDDEGADIDDLDPANQYDWIFRRYDRACLYLEYRKKKLDVKIPPVTEELKRLVDHQNEILARKFLEWQFVSQDPPQYIALNVLANDHPHALTYKFLQGTVQLFMDKICKNSTNYVVAALTSAPAKATQASQITASNSNSSFLSDRRNFLPARFVENIFNLFLVLRNLTMSEDDVDYATKEDDAIIFEKILKECENDDDPHWYYHSCGDQVLSVDYYHNYACIPFIKYDFNPRLYDPILDSVWIMFNAVHSFCFSHFQKNIKMWHRYAMIIANAYTPQMRLRWKASVASEKFYTRLLGPDFDIQLEQISRCMFGTVLRSEVPVLLPRFDTPSVTTFGATD